jgi:hypothetical protein
MAEEPRPVEAPNPGGPEPAAPAGAAPSAAGPAGGEPVREAPTRPLEAGAGVPGRGEREKPEQAAPPPAPAGEADVKIIEAPEAKPVSEMKPAFTPSEIKPILPDEKGVVVFDDASRVEWGEEERPGGAVVMKAGAPAKEGAAHPPAPAPGEGAAGRGGEAPPAERPGLPVHPPLPYEFHGTGRDIRRFIRNGTFMFLAGSLVYFLVAAYCLGVAFLNIFDRWAQTRAGDFGAAGLLALGLSAGAFSCMLLSRARLEEPLRRNDVAAVRRRLPVAVGAGLVFGLLLGGLLLHLARIKVDELPFPRADGPDGKAAAGEKA